MCVGRWGFFTRRHSYHSEAPRRGRTSRRCGQRDDREQGERGSSGDRRHAANFSLWWNTSTGIYIRPHEQTLILLSWVVNILKGLINDHINYKAVIKSSVFSFFFFLMVFTLTCKDLCRLCVRMSNFTPVMHRYNEVKVSFIGDYNKRSVSKMSSWRLINA